MGESSVVENRTAVPFQVVTLPVGGDSTFK